MIDKKYYSYAVKFAKTIKPYIFPQHHRKVTTTALTIGSILIVDGYFFGGLIQWAAISFISEHIGRTPPNFQEVSGDGKLYGTIIILSTLLYSFFIHLVDSASKWQSYYHLADNRNNRLRKDKNIFEEFMSDFGSQKPLYIFIKNHDFGSSFSQAESDMLFRFPQEWNVVERKFLDGELQEFLSRIVNLMNDLCSHINNASYPTANTNRYYIFDPNSHDDWNISPKMKSDIARANKIASEVELNRNSLIDLARNKFSFIP